MTTSEHHNHNSVSDTPGLKEQVATIPREFGGLVLVCAIGTMLILSGWDGINIRPIQTVMTLFATWLTIKQFRFLFNKYLRHRYHRENLWEDVRGTAIYTVLHTYAMAIGLTGIVAGTHLLDTPLYRWLYTLSPQGMLEVEVAGFPVGVMVTFSAGTIGFVLISRAIALFTRSNINDVVVHKEYSAVIIATTNLLGPLMDDREELAEAVEFIQESRDASPDSWEYPLRPATVQRYANKIDPLTRVSIKVQLLIIGKGILVLILPIWVLIGTNHLGVIATIAVCGALIGWITAPNPELSGSVLDQL